MSTQSAIDRRPQGAGIDKRRLWAVRALLMLSVVAVILVMAEIALRWLDPDGVPLTVKDPVLGHRYRAGASSSLYDKEAGRPIDIRINELGFRDVEHVPGRSTQPRVVILGDSFLAGFAVDFEDTLSQVLQQSLRRRTGHEWAIINFGVAAYSTAQELIAFEKLGARYHPDHVVLLFFAGNDVSDNSSELSSFPRPYYHLNDSRNLIPEDSSELRGFASRILNEHSRFYVWQKSRIREIERFFKRTVELDPVHRVFEDDYDPRVDRAWDITRALIVELCDQVERNGARFLLVYVPYSDEVNPGWWNETVALAPIMRERKWDLEKPSRLLAEIAAQERFDFLSPRSAMIDKVTGTGRPLYFPHGHFNEIGHRFVAELIAERILSERNDVVTLDRP